MCSYRSCRIALLAALASFSISISLLWAEIPLPEHPRPDWQRDQWMNLNGPWQFRFDPENVGEDERWFGDGVEFPEEILVPFPWGSPASGLEDRAQIGWYRRAVEIPADWKDFRVFLVFGACDWETTLWLDGRRMGRNRGGYTPFEFDLTGRVEPGEIHRLVARVDDRDRDFKLEGKQGYGNARGIWQTPYLEARGENPLSELRILPDLAESSVEVQARLLDPASADLSLGLRFSGEGQDFSHEAIIPAGAEELSIRVPLSEPRRWTLIDPHLYRVTATVKGNPQDRVETYFGFRQIGVASLPRTGHPYVALNGDPIYLQMALDQAFHPEGFYTYPSDAFLRDEIVRARKIGLNGIRVHVKTTIPRKLYWADRLGLLVMADVPNSWGTPTEEMKQDVEKAAFDMIRRDFNHPSIFSWVLFNETWGLESENEAYQSDTQAWVAEMYRNAKELDPTRLVEDNSPNQEDHVATDLNTWHDYLPGYAWTETLSRIVEQTYPGSPWNFVEGSFQDGDPLLNSECGNVWGYEGSTGDVDWSYDYHRMLNAFRRFPKIAGWLYTEFHDVINEWNGYYRFDRTEKRTGLDELVQGMTLEDLHSPFYLILGDEDHLVLDLEPNEPLVLPLTLSTHCIEAGDYDVELMLSGSVEQEEMGLFLWRHRRAVPLESWDQLSLEPLELVAPESSGLYILSAVVRGAGASILHRNFVALRVKGGRLRDPEATSFRYSFSVDSWSEADWSHGVSRVLEGLKVNGLGSGFFEFRLPWPEEFEAEAVTGAMLRLELSARPVLGRDQAEGVAIEGNFMRGRGTHDPTANPNAFPMTDRAETPSWVQILANGTSLGQFYLRDAPADHRGLLSWHAQKEDGKLREAGSYGYLVESRLVPSVLRSWSRSGELTIRLVVDDRLPGGLSLFGRDFGRYPIDPEIVFSLHETIGEGRSHGAVEHAAARGEDQ